MKFYDAVDMHQLALVNTDYTDLLTDVEEAILDNMHTFTCTVDVSSPFTAADCLAIKDELIQLGYGVNDSTTPGSWIITW